MSASEDGPRSRQPLLARGRVAVARNKDFIEAISLVMTAFIALVSAILFFYTYQKSADFQGEVVANETWERYREIGLEYEDLNRGNLIYDSLDSRQKSRYALLVERLLMAADLVTVTASDDNEWRAAFEIEFVKHKNYLLSNDFLHGTNGLPSEFCTYRRDARAWIAYAFRAEKGRPVEAAEKKCIDMGMTD